MGKNQTIEAPSFEKVAKEAGQFTSDAINILWASGNDTRATQRRDARRAIGTLAPDTLTLSPTGSVDNQDLGTATIVSFTGAGAQNLTGFKAPQTGESRILLLQVSGAGTITVKHNATSETANQIVCSTGADTALATNKGMLLVYLAAKWRQVAP